jgi:hypothetical protein
LRFGGLGMSYGQMPQDRKNIFFRGSENGFNSGAGEMRKALAFKNARRFRRSGDGARSKRLPGAVADGG